MARLFLSGEIAGHLRRANARLASCALGVRLRAPICIGWILAYARITSRPWKLHGWFRGRKCLAVMERGEGSPVMSLPCSTVDNPRSVRSAPLPQTQFSRRSKQLTRISTISSSWCQVLGKSRKEQRNPCGLRRSSGLCGAEKVLLDKHGLHRSVRRRQSVKASVACFVTFSASLPPYHPRPRWLTPTVLALAQAAYDNRSLPSGILDNDASVSLLMPSKTLVRQRRHSQPLPPAGASRQRLLVLDLLLARSKIAEGQCSPHKPPKSRSRLCGMRVSSPWMSPNIGCLSNSAFALIQGMPEKHLRHCGVMVHPRAYL